MLTINLHLLTNYYVFNWIMTVPLSEVRFKYWHNLEELCGSECSIKSTLVPPTTMSQTCQSL